MRLTLTPTQITTKKTERQPIVEITVDDDHPSLDTLIDQVLAPAIAAWGYGDLRQYIIDNQEA